MRLSERIEAARGDALSRLRQVLGDRLGPTPGTRAWIVAVCRAHGFPSIAISEVGVGAVTITVELGRRAWFWRRWATRRKLRPALEQGRPAGVDYAIEVVRRLP